MRYPVLTSFILTGALGATAASYAGITSTWVGPASGMWNVSANWSSGVPGSVGVTGALILSGGEPVTVTLDTYPTIEILMIGANCTLLQQNDRDITLAAVSNNGLWAMGSVGNLTDIALNAPIVTIDGVGTLSLGTHVNNRIYGVGDVRRLVNGASHTIRGSGQVGLNNNLLLTNHGTMRADQPSSQMEIDLNVGDNRNDGVLVATNGAQLSLMGTDLNNVAGAVRAEDASVVRLQSSTITGGDLVTEGSGVIRTTPQGASLANLVNHGTVELPNDADLFLYGTIIDDGTIAMKSVGNLTDMRVASDPVTLSGSGSVVMSGHINNRIFGTGDVNRLVNGTGHTIRGVGQIGINTNLLLTNEGVIAADQPSAVLSLDLTPGDNQNDGLLVARFGGQMNIVGTVLDNGDGVVLAEDASAVVFESSTITGGQLVTEGTGVLRVTPVGASIADLKLAGTLELPNDAEVYLYGTIIDDGTIAMKSVGNLTDMRIATDPVTLSGSGSVVMTGHMNNRIFGTGTVNRLVNGTGHTIRGVGQIGINTNLLLTNEGVIAADQPSSVLTLDLTPGDNQNDGLLAARYGSQMDIVGTVLDNGDGVILAEDTSVVRLESSTITGGQLVTEGSGVFRVTPVGASIENLKLAGTLDLPNDAEVYLYGAIVDDGTIAMKSVGNYTDVRVASDPVTLSGSGALVMSGHINNRIFGTGAVNRLVNAFGHTIRGRGQIGVNSNLDVTNKGMIVADDGTMTIDVTNDFTNEGELLVTGVGQLSILAGTFVNLGQFVIETANAATRTGSFNQQDGVTRVDGTLSLSAGASVLVSGGLVSGDGTINGGISVSGGSASPARVDNAIASLTVNGTYSQTLDGGYVVDLGLGGNDLLAVNGNVNLGGALQIRLDGAFTPAVGQEFVVLTATGTISGFWQCVEFPTAAAGYFDVVYAAHQIKVVVGTSPPQEADLDNDGMVGPTDLGILLGAWGDEPCNNAICCPADLNGDGKVNAIDLGTLLGSWG